MLESTIFIVDDDQGVRDSLALLLSLHGYKTQIFASAEDFLASLKPSPAGCLLLDLRMPGMSGLELQEVLRARGDGLPLIMITAHGDVASTRAALKGGAHDFLEKPIDDAVLLDVLKSVLD